MKIPRSSNWRKIFPPLRWTRPLEIPCGSAWSILNCLRASISVWHFRMGILIHPRPLGGNGDIVSGLNVAEASALGLVEKLHLVSKKR
jgi:hypothetical protein